MNNQKNPKKGHNKKTFLEKPVEHIDITSFDSRKIIESIIFLESKDVTSICSTGFSRKVFLL